MTDFPPPQGPPTRPAAPGTPRPPQPSVGADAIAPATARPVASPRASRSAPSSAPRSPVASSPSPTTATRQPAAAATVTPVADAHNAIAALVTKAEPSIVSIHDDITQTDQFGQTQSGQAAGSGFVLSADGYIVTNDHVVDGATDITVDFHDGSTATATIVAADPNSDLAVLKVDRTGLTPLPMGDSSSLAGRRPARRHRQRPRPVRRPDGHDRHRLGHRPLARARRTASRSAT